ARAMTPTHSGANLIALGESLVSLGTASDRTFEETMQTVWWSTTSLQITALEHALNNHAGRPEFWSFDVQSRILFLRESITKQENLVPPDIIDLVGAEQALSFQRELICNFGQLLKVWPKLWQTARELSASRVRIGVSL